MLLGITINNKLNWNSHMNKVTNKIPKTVGILNKLRPLHAFALRFAAATGDVHQLRWCS